MTLKAAAIQVQSVSEIKITFRKAFPSELTVQYPSQLEYQYIVECIGIIKLERLYDTLHELQIQRGQSRASHIEEYTQL